VTPRRAGPLAVLLASVGALTAACADGSTSAGEQPPAPEITVAAASDLRVAFEELGERFTAETGTTVTFSFGSSGQLREQIVNGAPFDLFASANVDYVDAVIEAGVGVADTRADYGYGRLALWAPPGRAVPSAVEDLADPRFRRIAIANPDHAPYGQAAVEALEAAGVREAVTDRLVYGENVSDTLRLVQSGNADVGIVALSLVIADGGNHVLVPDSLHEPLRQSMVVTRTGARGRSAGGFAAYVNGPAGREVMVRYGFALPGEVSDEP
jgi:molybdate transport system substrate-binding protein